MEKTTVRRQEIDIIKFSLIDGEGKSREVADALRRAFVAENDKKGGHFWIDLSKAPYVNSTFLGVISFMVKEIKEGEIVLSGISREIESILDASGLPKLPNLLITRRKNINFVQ